MFKTIKRFDISRSFSFLIVLLFLFASRLDAQTIFVDAVKGHDEAKGTITDPFASLEKAVALASGFSGNEPITIRIYPGLYVLQHKLEIRTDKVSGDTVKYIIEAVMMPDDPDWQPNSMPVIQSVSANNSTTQFTHATGFLVAKNNVRFQGLKFLGNSNPSVPYYYPITRENETYAGLEISQCYFIGEKNSAPIQGAVWAHGAGTKIDHCIFYGCKNALLLFKSIKDFSITYSIISGAYEAAAWYGGTGNDFEFRNNIITNCNFFWVRAENTFPTYTFSNSVITDVNEYMGYWSSHGLIRAEKNSHSETGIRKSGKIMLSEVKTEGLPKDYLNLLPQSDGNELKAGIFKNE